MGAGDDRGVWFAEHLSAEVSRLEEAIGLLALLTGAPGGEPEPLSLVEVLPGTLELWSRASGSPLPVSLDHDGVTPPVLVPWASLHRAVLLLLHRCDGWLRRAGATGLRMSLRGDDEEALLRVTGLGDEPEGEIRIGSPDSGELGGLVDVWASLEGRLAVEAEPDEDGDRLLLRLPALSAVR